jgi:hypothetical protein
MKGFKCLIIAACLTALLWAIAEARVKGAEERAALAARDAGLGLRYATALGDSSDLYDVASATPCYDGLLTLLSKERTSLRPWADQPTGYRWSTGHHPESSEEARHKEELLTWAAIPDR